MDSPEYKYFFHGIFYVHPSDLVFSLSIIHYLLYIHVKLKIFEREEVAINRRLRDTFVVCFSACHKSSRSCEWVQWCLFLNILKWHRFYRNKKKQWPKINKQTRETNRVEHFFLSVSSHYAVKHEWALTCLLDTTSTTLGVSGKICINIW